MKAKFKVCNDEGIACGGKVGHQATSMRAKPTNAWADNFKRHRTSAVSVCQSIYKVSQKCKPGHHRCPKCPKSVEGASAASHSVSVPLPAAASAPRPGLYSICNSTAGGILNVSVMSNLRDDKNGQKSKKNCKGTTGITFKIPYFFACYDKS